MSPQELISAFYGPRPKAFVPEGKAYGHTCWLDPYGFGTHNRKPKRIAIRVFSFLIDCFPVTRGEFLAFAGAGRRLCKSSQNVIDESYWAWFAKNVAYPDNCPIVGVTYHEAEAYASWLGGRLPRLAEWNRAASGGMPQDYPWGHRFEANNLNLLRGDLGGSICEFAQKLTPVDQYPKGQSDFGVVDCLGNCREWTSSPWLRRYMPRRSLSGNAMQLLALATESEVFTVGGSLPTVWSVTTTKTDHRNSPFSHEFPGELRRGHDLGFRVVYDVASVNSLDEGLFAETYASDHTSELGSQDGR